MKLRALLPMLLIPAALVVFQFIATAAGKEYYLTQLIMAAYYSMVALGLCLVMGFAGQVSLGHGAFFAIGGYTSAVLTTHDLPALHDGVWAERLHALGIVASRSTLYGGEVTTVTPWAAFGAAMLLTLCIALLIGYPALRLKGYYLAMATLGFGLIVYRIALGSEITGGADGVTGVPPWHLGGGLTVSGRKAFRVQNYYIAWILVLLVLMLLRNVVHSRVGRAMRAIHGAERAANAMGVNTPRYKLKAFMISALLAAAAGSFMTHYNGGIGPAEAGAMKSVRYVALVAAGGMANLWGVLTVSSLINFLSLRGYFGTLDHALFGVILIVIISVAPEGPFKPVGAWLSRARRKRRGTRAHALTNPEPEAS